MPMLIGILSDTHGRADVMRGAVELLQKGGAEHFIHCGDVGATEVLDHLAGLAGAFVWGNCDYDREGLQRHAAIIGIACLGPYGDLSLDGKRIAVIHGDDMRLRQRLLEEQGHDYLLQGHTHIPADLRVGRTRLINPGALYRANPRTVALLDTGMDRLTHLALPV